MASALATSMEITLKRGAQVNGVTGWEWAVWSWSREGIRFCVATGWDRSKKDARNSAISARAYAEKKERGMIK